MKCNLFFNKEFVIGEIDKNIYGSFVEHIGRCVYTGIYEKDHPTADKYGFRGDVKNLCKELGVTNIRYPGGNFVSGYNWRDGIGKNRPTRLNIAWQQTEPNEVGLHEFYDYSKECNFDTMMCCNLGTGTPLEASHMLEYCNFAGETSLTKERASNGQADPFNIKYWCLGNEMDGDWQICSMPPEDYAKKSRDAAKLMKKIDPSILLTVCGSSNTVIESYPSWDRVVLENMYDLADYISVHSYYYTHDGDNDVNSYLASYKHFEDNINTIIATCDYVKALKRSNKTMMLSVDEWNVWRTYENQESIEPWGIDVERLESKYNLLDALVFGSLMTVLLEHCDRVKIACLAQLVNVIAPILTKKGGDAIRQTIFYPFSLISKYCRGITLRSINDSIKVDSAKYGQYSALKTAVTYDGETGSIVVVNNSLDDSCDLVLPDNVEAFEAYTLNSNDVYDCNTFENPFKVAPKCTKLNGNKVTISNHSFNLIRFKFK